MIKGAFSDFYKPVGFPRPSLPEAITDDKKLALLGGIPIQYLSERLRNDKETVLTYIEKSPYNFQDASKALRGDSEVVLFTFKRIKNYSIGSYDDNHRLKNMVYYAITPPANSDLLVLLRAAELGVGCLWGSPIEQQEWREIADLLENHRASALQPAIAPVTRHAPGTTILHAENVETLAAKNQKLDAMMHAAKEILEKPIIPTDEHDNVIKMPPVMIDRNLLFKDEHTTNFLGDFALDVYKYVENGTLDAERDNLRTRMTNFIQGYLFRTSEGQEAVDQPEIRHIADNILNAMQEIATSTERGASTHL